MKVKKEFKIQDLYLGDSIVHKTGGHSYIITANYGNYAIAVRTVHISNPSEWILLKNENNEKS